MLKPSVALGIQTLTYPAWSWILRLSNIAPEAQLLRSLPHRRPCHPKRSGLYSTANLLHRERNFGPKPKIRSSLLRILCLIPWLGFSLHESRVNYQRVHDWYLIPAIYLYPSFFATEVDPSWTSCLFARRVESLYLVYTNAFQTNMASAIIRWHHQAKMPLIRYSFLLILPESWFNGNRPKLFNL